MTLYDINNKILEILEKGISINEETGEFFDFEDLEQLELNKTEKIENIALFIKNLTILDEGLKREIKVLQERKKSNEKKIERLKEYLSSFLTDKLETPKVKLSFRKSEKLMIEDEESIPAEFWKTRITETIDKIELKKAIKKGLKLKNVAIVEQRNLQIK